MRTFLTDKKIVGAMLVSRCGEILHVTIPHLLKWCDWILLMQDNLDEKTRKIAKSYNILHPCKVRLVHTGIPRATEEQEKSYRGLFRRFKPLQGPIRDTVFQYFHKIVKAGEVVDMIIWPDSDEIFNEHFKDLLIAFDKDKNKWGMTMKPVDVFGDYMTVRLRGMTGHTRVLKYRPDLTAVPYRTACNYRPLTRSDRVASSRYLIHLSSLTKEKRDWRMSHWKPINEDNEPLWKLPEDVRTIHPDKIVDMFRNRPPDSTAGEYLRGGEKRMPMGSDNANKALRESSDMLDKMGVRHYLAFGTVLGIVRDGEIIKWDWDIDYIINGEDLDKFDPIMVKKHGFYEYKRKQDIPKAIINGVEDEQTYVRTISFKKYGVRIDLDPMYISKDGKNRIILKGRKRQKFCAKHPAEWFGDKTIEYNGKKYLIPSPIDEYLKSNYGDGWKKPQFGPTKWSERACMSKNYECL
jgi:hypothetical protein